MNSVLVIFILYGTTFTPKFAIHYDTQEKCIHRIHDYDAFPKRHRKAKCVPILTAKIPPAEDSSGILNIVYLTDEQITALKVTDEIYWTREHSK